MISLEYHDTLSAAAGEALEKHREEIIKRYWGNYILAVEGNPPLGEDGMYCVVGGKAHEIYAINAVFFKMLPVFLCLSVVSFKYLSKYLSRRQE